MRTYWLLAAIIPVVLLSCSTPDPLPSLTETYSRTDKNPFGAYVAFREVNEMFYRNDVRVKKTPLDRSLDDDYNDNSALYICISEHFYLKSSELSALMNFIRRGNNAFISARYFDSSFLDELKVSVNDRSPLSYIWQPLVGMKHTSVKLSVPPYTDNADYSYYYLPCSSSITLPEDSSDVRVLGSNENGTPNFIVLFYGKGRVYIHCEPRVFGNYFLLKENNYKYMQHALSFMPRVPDNVFWDDFYNKRDYIPKDKDNGEENNNGSTLSVLFRYPAMAWAFWLTLLSLLLYILFGSKRRQRIIKPLPVNDNTTVAFTETVGRLYLQKKDNRNMADKMITYLLEHIRNQYFISTNNLNQDFVNLVSRKSGYPQEETGRLFFTINKIQKATEVDDHLLLSLNRQIDNFYKHK